MTADHDVPASTASATPSDGAPGSGRHHTQNLGHRASRGVFVTLGGQWGRTLVQLASTMVLARLLVPGDFGLVAMVMAIVGVADLVRDFGMTGAIVQAREIGERLWRSVMWLSVAIGVALSLLVAASAPLIASLYDNPRLVVLTLVIAPTLFANGMAMPLQARLQREMRFGPLAQIDVASMAVGVVGSIIAALLGWGVWSLVILAGAGQLYRLIALWVIVKPEFGRPHIDRAVIPLLTTGGSIFGVQLLTYVTRNLDNVFIGRQLGAADLGQYTRGYALFMMPLQQLTGPLARVALPVLSALQDDAARYRRYVRGSLMIIAYLSLPVYAVISAVADPLIRVFLGPDWGLAATALSLLSIAGVAQAIGNVQGWLFITLGRTKRQLVYFAVTRPIVIGTYLLGLWWGGVPGLALGYGLITLALLVPGYAIAIKGTFVRASDILSPVLRPALLVAPVYLAAWAVTTYVPGGAIVQLVLGGLAGVVPVAAAMAIPAYRRDVGELLRFVKQARKPAPKAAAAPEAGAVDGAGSVEATSVATAGAAAGTAAGATVAVAAGATVGVVMSEQAAELEAQVEMLEDET